MKETMAFKNRGEIVDLLLHTKNAVDNAAKE